MPESRITPFPIMVIRTLTFPLLLVLASCQYDPFAHRYLDKEPSREEAAGTYILEACYVDMVESGLSERIRSATITPSITLRPDGIAELKGFPLFHGTDGLNYSFEGLHSFERSWSILPVGTVSSGGDSATTVYGVRFELPGGETLFDSPTFTGEDSVDGFVFTLYDGDQGQALIFRKES